MDKNEIKKAVREGYADIAKKGGSCCSNQSACCSASNLAEDLSKKIGYSDEELSSVPEGSNLGLGCGNPIAIASLKEGDIVLDLGSGAGFDCFLAANKVGRGRVIGVDMTPEMIEKARENARRGNYNNVEFRLGEIENLPVPDNFVDVIISNCVINLSPDKDRVFHEAFRTLKPGGRLNVSDIVLLKALPQKIVNSISAYISCISGASLKDTYLTSIKSAGFQNIDVLTEDGFDIECIVNDPIITNIVKEVGISSSEMQETSRIVKSIKVQAQKPLNS